MQISQRMALEVAIGVVTGVLVGSTAYPVSANESRICLPAYWGGILAGMSTDAQVTQLYGAGRFEESQGDTAARI